MFIMFLWFETTPAKESFRPLRSQSLDGLSPVHSGFGDPFEESFLHIFSFVPRVIFDSSVINL